MKGIVLQNVCYVAVLVSVAFQTVSGATGCELVLCPAGTTCRENKKGEARCVCITACTREYAPVCGSDGKTYSNQCELQREACQTKEVITVANDGQCNAGSPCDVVECAAGRSCEVNSDGQAQCDCNTMCPMLFDPVCGSDGKTYSNTCELQREACQTDTNITVAQNGACDAETPA